MTDKLLFPTKDTVFFNDNVNDGTTFAFSIENNNKTKRILIHQNSGPKSFWKLGEWLDNFKDKSKFKLIERKVKFDNFEKMIPIPDRPISN